MPHLKLLFCLLLHVHTLLFQYTTKQQLMKEFLIYYISTLYTCLLLTHSQSWRTLFPCHRTLNVKVLKTLSSPSFCCCSQLQPKIQNMHYYVFMYRTLCSLYTSMRIKSPCTFTLNMEANSWDSLILAFTQRWWDWLVCDTSKDLDWQPVWRRITGDGSLSCAEQFTSFLISWPVWF